MKTKKVLIVDDDIDVITVIETILKKEGLYSNLSQRQSGRQKISIERKTRPGYS